VPVLLAARRRRPDCVSLLGAWPARDLYAEPRQATATQPGTVAVRA